MNGCSFCVDIGRAMATYQGLTFEKLDAVARLAHEPALHAARARRARLRRGGDARQARQRRDVRRRCARTSTSEQIVAITWLNAVENYFNLLNGPLGIESDGLCAIAEHANEPTAAPCAAARPAA